MARTTNSSKKTQKTNQAKANQAKATATANKKPARKALGRGINALLGDDPPNSDLQNPKNSQSTSFSASPGTSPNFLDLPIESIIPNSAQPRTSFPEAELAELAQSIRTNGIVQPIIVRESRTPTTQKKERQQNSKSAKPSFHKTNKTSQKIQTTYEIVAGERRWRAAQRAELKTIPAIIRKIDDNKMLEIALIENIQRQELNPVEESLAYRKLIDDMGLTQASVAERVGKTRTFVANYLRLLNLPNPILALLRDGRLTVGHAKALLSIDNAKLQKSLADEILARGLSVRDAEKAAKRPRKTPNQPTTPPKPDPNITNAEVKLRRKYSTHVKITPSRQKLSANTKSESNGKIEFEYYGLEDLDRIFSLLMTTDN